jgi:hypothetical protein
MHRPATLNVPSEAAVQSWPSIPVQVDWYTGFPFPRLLTVAVRHIPPAPTTVPVAAGAGGRGGVVLGAAVAGGDGEPVALGPAELGGTDARGSVAAGPEESPLPADQPGSARSAAWPAITAPATAARTMPTAATIAGRRRSHDR